MGSIPSGITEAQTHKLTMGARRCGKQFSGPTSVGTQIGFPEVLARYLVSIEIACMPRLLRHGI